MLKNISPLLGPDALHILASMGHGDDLVIADANFPGATFGKRLVRLDGVSATAVLDAVLSLFPLDEFVEDRATTMQVVGDPNQHIPIVGEFAEIVKRHEPHSRLTDLERFAFYDRAADAFAVIQTGEARLYGNIIVRKGVVRPDDGAA